MARGRVPRRRLLGWVYERPGWFPALTDAAAWGLTILAAGLIGRLFTPPVVDSFRWVLLVAGFAAVVQLAGGWILGTYRHRWKISSFEEVLATGQAWGVTSLLTIGGSLWLASSRPSWVLAGWSAVIGAMYSFVAIVSSRVVWRGYWELHRRPDPRTAKRTLVFGAGDGAEQVIRLMLQDRDSHYLPVAMLDDHPTRRNRVIHGVRVKGTSDDVSDVAAAESAEVLLVAVRNLDPSVLKRLGREASALGLEMKVMPSTSALVGSMKLSDLRPPTVEELLGRPSVEIDVASVAGIIRGKRVLITGAGGSIGSELSRLVDQFEPSELYLLDRDESALHSLQLSMEGKALLDSDRLVVADIRDRRRIFELFQTLRPEVVFHVAALKHLTLLENHPDEGIKTNVIGTKNLLDAAVESGVERFVNISTDKAADPTSVLGASKLAAERLTARVSDETGKSFVSVRFGNVLGSRGSVLPTFLEQIRQDQPITVTDPEVTRFFMTIPEAVRLVVQAGAIGRPGEVMILDMGEPVRIVELAEQLVETLKPGHPIIFTGLRPGEKLHEVLVGTDEVTETREHPRVLHTSGDRADPADAFGMSADGARINDIRQMIEQSEIAHDGHAVVSMSAMPESGVAS